MKRVLYPSTLLLSMALSATTVLAKDLSVKLLSQEAIMVKQDVLSTQTTQNRYALAIKNLMADMDFKGAERAAPVSDNLYNVTIRGWTQYKGLAMANVPSKLWDVAYNTTACHMEITGGCLVIEKDHEGKAAAFYFGVVNGEESVGSRRLYRNQVTNAKHASDIQYLYDVENGEMTVYSKAGTQEEIIPVNPWEEQRRRAEEEARKKQEEEERKKKEEVSAQDLRERASIKEKILKGKAIDGDLLRKHFRATQEEIDARLAEEEFDQIYSQTGHDFHQIRRNNGLYSSTCYVAGKLEVDRGTLLFLQYDKKDKTLSLPFFGKELRLGGRRLISLKDTKPYLKGKAKVLCYKDGQVVQQRGVEIKYFADFLNVGLSLPIGTYYVASVGVGFHDGIIDLITQKQPDGSLLPYRDWIYMANADLAYGVGVGAHAVGLSSGRQQKPILSLFSARAGKDVLGVNLSIFSRGRMGIDPDDF